MFLKFTGHYASSGPPRTRSIVLYNYLTALGDTRIPNHAPEAAATA
ncbi:MAG TPA: hypothetical protein VE445_09620 [Nitrososphaeraceae archaeon]|jgi:hypothetical protein|nr:hypothetical protein [Nitrososphaeraceae archaeon]